MSFYIRMNEWLNKPVRVLITSKERGLLVLVTGLFTVIFMNLYLPFNISRLHEGDSIPLYLDISSYGLIGMVFLFFSQFILRPVFRFNSFTNKTFIFWVLCEILVLSFVLFLIYRDMSIQGFKLIDEYLLFLKYTLLVIVIPYAAVVYYLYNRHLTEYKAIPDSITHDLLKIRDENQNVKIAIQLERLLFIKNADNYVEVYYLDEDQIKKELIRTSLKLLEDELRLFRIIRCHRSYMVNLSNIALTKKSRNGLVIKQKAPGSPDLPVSKKYSAILLQTIE